MSQLFRHKPLGPRFMNRALCMATALLLAVAPLFHLDAQSMEVGSEIIVARRQSAPFLNTWERSETRVQEEGVVHVREFIVAPPQSAPSLVPTPERSMARRDPGGVLEVMRGAPWDPMPKQSSKRVKWAIVGGVTGATIGFLAWGAWATHQSAPGVIIFLPAYVASGTLLGAAVGAIAAQ